MNTPIIKSIIYKEEDYTVKLDDDKNLLIPFYYYRPHEVGHGGEEGVCYIKIDRELIKEMVSE